MVEIADPAPGPVQVVAARDEIEMLANIIESMPRRRRAIFLAIRVDGLSNQDAALRFGVSPRLVGLELKRAHEYCMAHMPKDE
jgi:RNA polymerase sigma-70 factor (ECF subfamily)